LNAGASPGQKCGVDTHGERAEREPITGVWVGAPAESTSRAPAQGGGKAP